MNDILYQLRDGVQQNEKAKGKRRQVFKLSFEARQLDEKEVKGVLKYIHRNRFIGVEI